MILSYSEKLLSLAEQIQSDRFSPCQQAFRKSNDESPGAASALRERR
jgi:hypothetical protein